MGKVKSHKKKKVVSKLARGKYAKSIVFKGLKVKTSTGLSKSDLVRSKTGKIVSKKRSLNGKKVYQKNGLAKFNRAVFLARKALGIQGFQAVGGKTPKGIALLKKARSLYKK